MGLLKRFRRDPVIHPLRTWRIHCHAPSDAVTARLIEHADLGGGSAPVTACLAADRGWTTLVVEGRLHPWALHNLALWLVDIPCEVVLHASTGSHGEPGWWLADDPHDSWLCGWDDMGHSLTVRVPDNAVVRGDTIHLPQRSGESALTALGVPDSLHGAAPSTTPSAPVDLDLEDPQHEVNPTCEPTHDTREELDRDPFDEVWAPDSTF